MDFLAHCMRIALPRDLSNNASIRNEAENRLNRVNFMAFNSSIEQAQEYVCSLLIDIMHQLFPGR